MTLLLTRAEALAAMNTRTPSCDYGILLPRQLNSGLFGVSEKVLTDPCHEAARPILQQGSIAAVNVADYLDTDSSHIYVDGKLCRVATDHKDYAIAEVANDVFRFVLAPGDVGDKTDAQHRARSELINSANKYSAGDTVWRSWWFMTETDPSKEIHVGQYHSVDTDIGRAPVLAYYLLGGNLTIRTRSSAAIAQDGSGVPVLHYSAPFAKNTWFRFVEKVTFGQSGALSVWLNGTQIVNNASVPVGYYTDAQLGYVHNGIYLGQEADTVEETFAVRYANLQWGFDDLNDRIANPLPIAA